MKTLSAAILLATLFLPGCATPASVRAEVEHVSHPLAGWPVSAANSEDGLSQLNVIGHWQSGRVYVEHGLGWNMDGRNGGGFYGPGLTYTGRIGVQLWSAK
jgi:hypothetical protein